MIIICLKAQVFTIYFKRLEQMNSFLTSHMFDFEKVAWALLFRLIYPLSFTSILTITSITRITTALTGAIIISVILIMSTSAIYY